jgi:16S rRNA processing protein RimM
MRMPRPNDEFLTIGKILKPHGRRGEVAVEVLTDFPDRFAAGAEVLLRNNTGAQAARVEESRSHKGRVILKLAGCDSISAAEALVGLWIEVPGTERKVLPRGVVYLADLVGCAVREGGETLGTVEAVQEQDEKGESGAPVLLQVRTPGGELLIPFAAEICRRVDVEGRQIEVRLPEGLRDLNRSAAALGKRRKDRAARVESGRGPHER